MTINEQENTNELTLGKALQDARLSASLTVEEVALQLNLAISTVHDIEDDLDHLIELQQIPDIYLRGYIVNYAKLVALKTLDQFPAFKLLSSSHATLKNIIPAVKISSPRKRGKRLLLSFFLLIILGLGFFVIQQFFFSENNLLMMNKEMLEPENKSISLDTERHLIVKKKIVTSDETGK